MRWGWWVGALFVIGRVASYRAERFTMGWLAAEMLTVGVIVVGFMLTSRRIGRLETKVEGLQRRLDTIARSMREGLRSLRDRVVDLRV